MAVHEPPHRLPSLRRHQAATGEAAQVHTAAAYVFGLSATGDLLGLGRWWARLPLVRDRVWLR